MSLPYSLDSVAILRTVSRSRPTASRRPWRASRLERWLASNPSPSPQCQQPRLPFRFDTGVALFAKRAPRPFPPPFLSPPSASFSDALSTHDQSRDRRAFVDGQIIRGLTNGDDAVYASDNFVCANDGVGAWATRPRGHAGLWSRLILHFWSAAIDDISAQHDSPDDVLDPEPIKTLQKAYEQTVEVTGKHGWQGTTTACGAQLHYVVREQKSEREATPLLYVTNLGDCQILVVRPKTKEVLYKTKEQWHWFDCPRQLGTNSPDTPEENGVTDTIDIEVGDVVLAMSDGVIDNLWEHEIVETIVTAIGSWETDDKRHDEVDRSGGRNGGMTMAAQELVAAAKRIAMDPYAESPYMEHAIEEGLASEGGKMDDISVVAALCVKNER